MIALAPVTPPLPLTPPSPSKDCSMYSFLFTAKNLSLVYFSQSQKKLEKIECNRGHFEHIAEENHYE